MNTFAFWWILSGLFLFPPFLLVWRKLDKRRFKERLTEAIERPGVGKDEIGRVLVLPQMRGLEYSAVVFVFIFLFQVRGLEDTGLQAAWAIPYIGIVAHLIMEGRGRLSPAPRAVIAMELGHDLIVDEKEAAVELLFESMLDAKWIQYRQGALSIAKVWGSVRMKVRLEKMLKGKSRTLYHQAKGIRDRIEEGYAMAADPDIWKSIRYLTEHFAFWRYLFRATEGEDHREVLDRFASESSVPGPLQNFVHQARLTRPHYPHLYSKQHRRWAKLKRINELDFARCPVSFSLDPLVYPVQQVTGFIGGGKKWERLGEEVRISVWDREDKRVNFAEVDQLELLPVENPDWALAAVLEKFRNLHPKPWPRVKISPGVELKENTRTLVRQFEEEGQA